MRAIFFHSANPSRSSTENFLFNTHSVTRYQVQVDCFVSCIRKTSFTEFLVKLRQTMSALILTTEFLVLLITSIQAFQYGMPMNNLANIFYNGYPQSMYPVYPQQPLTAATPMTWPTSARQEQVVMPSPTSKIPINVEDVELNVRHLITLNYQKRTYVMVENLTLPFTEAENFCVKKFCEEMHLASVHTNEEWVSNLFEPRDDLPLRSYRIIKQFITASLLSFYYLEMRLVRHRQLSYMHT